MGQPVHSWDNPRLPQANPVAGRYSRGKTYLREQNIDGMNSALPFRAKRSRTPQTCYIMFGFLKNLLGKKATKPAQPQGPRPYAPSALTGHGGNGARHASNGRNGASAKGVPAYRNGQNSNGVGIELPLQKVVDSLPVEILARLSQTDVGDLKLSIPLERILPQLSQGMVKISYLELCHSAPEVFAAAPELDNTEVPLPLGEILTRINPALIRRRRAQRQSSVPDDISSPFDAQARGATPVSRHTVPAASNEAVRPGVASEPAELPSRGGLSSGPTAPQPPGIPFAAPALPKPQRVPQRPEPEKPKPLTLAKTPPPVPVQEPARTEIPRPTLPAPTPQTPAAPQPVVAAPKPESQNSPIVINLTSLAEAWPDNIRKEVVQASLVDARVFMPYEVAEQALRQGKVAFKWATVREWMQPAPRNPSTQEDVAVELPLKVLAPLFLARRAQNKPQQRIEIDDNIPNLFFGFPQPEAPAAVVTATPADTNFYVWDDRADTVRTVDETALPAPSVGTKFVSKYATPNEIVSRAAALDGVAGAVIALPDGLLVASRIPPEFNADTLAAFLPQIFGKVSQCTKELRMGDLNNLNFTVGNLPWKIFRVNAIFFAAFGKAGEPLPTARLAALAAELDHKPK